MSKLLRIQSLSKLVLGVCLVIGMASCGHKDEKEIEQDQASGIVLVQNKSFYEVKMPNDESLYFTSYDADDGIKGLSFEADSVEVAVNFGTGFFVGEDGTIATNAHVISNSIDDKDIQKSIGSFFESLKSLLSAAYDEKAEALQQLNYAYEIANYSPEISYSDFYAIKEARDALVAEMNEMQSTYSVLDDMRANDCEVKYHNDVSIAYNDTHVTKNSDFTSCVIKKTDSEHDLALIQLNTKKTPEGKYVFTVEEEDPYEHYSFGDKIKSTMSGDKNERLFVHGFNMGPVLGETKEGLKAQFTSGSVSQHTADQLMYTIPTLGGSSGSPVVNRDGQLVGVNSAKVRDTQSFNIGIRVKHLKNLLDK